MLSRLAREFAAEIANHDWTDAPYRTDRAGHRRSSDSPSRLSSQLSFHESDCVRINVMWVTAQVLGHADPNFDVAEFAKACGVNLESAGVQSGLRRRGEAYAIPGTYDYEHHAEVHAPA
jgi:hypothetical protein